MTRRKDWADTQARQIHDIISQNGVSREVSVGYIASELRVAHQRGAIGASKTKDAAS